MRKIFIFVFTIVLSLQVSGISLANTLPPNAGSLIDDLNNNLKRQEQLKKQITDAKNKEKSLASQISYMEDQIELTSLQIDETNERLTSLGNNIIETIGKLDNAVQNYDHMVSVKDVRVRKIYRDSFVGPLEVLLTSDNVNDLLLKQKYADAVHQADIALMAQLKETRDNIEIAKVNLEKEKSDQENLKSTLVNKQNSLASQKSQKAYLLEVTKNDEANYQRLLVQARLDQQAIQAALSLRGNKLGPVNRGDVIAFQGNTGCSSGTHLHFGYIVGGGAVDPMPYLRSGSLAWPETNPIITQPFGANPGLLPGYQNGHPAIDMTAGWNAPIYAAKNGVAYLAGDGGCPGFAGYHQGPGKGIIIDHGDGTKTLYWHIR